jgi:hypothetical protein
VQTSPINPPFVIGSQIINNQPPQFDSINTFKNYYKFGLKGGPGVNAGTPTSVNIDLEGKPRPVGPAPDLGSFEKQ